MRVRFSLATMMVLTTLLGLSLGYVQSLRVDNQRKIERLKKLGVEVSNETFWLGAPKEAYVSCRDNPNCDEIFAILEGMGVRHIRPAQER